MNLNTYLSEQHCAIVGRTGAGKSYAAKTVIEYLLDEGRRVCIIDPTGAHWGLRSSADGKHNGFPIAVFGGEHGDVPITASSGAALAAVVAEHNLPAIVDVSEMLIGERHRFAEDFFAELYRLNRKPLHLVIDEADEFAPQNPLPETKRMLHQVDRIVRRGRIRGFRVMFITQRPAVLHKNILTQANSLVAMRLTAPQDRKAVEEWVKGQADMNKGREVLATLAGLKRGEGWVWCPEHDILKRHTFPRIKTFDSGRAPEDGSAPAAPTKITDVDLTAIRDALQDAEREAAANDPKVLRKRIAELERQLREKPQAPPAERVEVPALTDKQIERLEKVLTKMHAEAEKHGQAMSMLWKDQLEQAGALLGVLRAVAAPQKPIAVPRPQVSAPRAVAPQPVRDGKASAEIGAGGLRRILIALAQRNGLTQRQLGLRAGLSSRSGTFATYLSRARAMGWIEGRGQIHITSAGIAALGHYDPLPEGRELLDYWLGELGDSGAARILRALADAYPRSLSQDVVGEAAGLSARSGTFATYLSRLRTLELITGRGDLRASDEFFQ